MVESPPQRSQAPGIVRAVERYGGFADVARPAAPGATRPLSSMPARLSVRGVWTDGARDIVIMEH